MMLEARQVAKYYGDTVVLHPLDIQLHRAERLAIIGETGSGKTTLMKALAGLVDLSAGTVLFEGKRVSGPSEVLLPGHPSISYLSQSVVLRNHYRVMDLLERHSIQPLSDDWTLAKMCRIDHLMERKTDELSGGERQRIGLAIELSKKPTVLLLDEPFSNLDIGHRNILRGVLDDLHAQMGLTVGIVSHNPSEILGWADRILVMHKGHCLQVGTPQEIYLKPSNGYTAQLLGPFNVHPDSTDHAFMIIRPERLSFSPPGLRLTEGTIEKVEYEGIDYLYQVRSNENILYVRSFDRTVGVGDRATIFVKENYTA